MSHQQFQAQVQQWEELELAGKEEAAWREKEDDELERQEREFCANLEEQFPILKSWSTK